MRATIMYRAGDVRVADCATRRAHHFPGKRVAMRFVTTRGGPSVPFTTALYEGLVDKVGFDN